ncbi:MAG: hypothetical protein AB7G75_02110 [Candidatus Binatia bacterium]
MHEVWQSLVFLLPVSMVMSFLAFPLVAVFLKVLPQEGAWATLQQPLVTEALHLSVVTLLSSLGLAPFLDKNEGNGCMRCLISSACKGLRIACRALRLSEGNQIS